jgi:hypothetical protein
MKGMPQAFTDAKFTLEQISKRITAADDRLNESVAVWVFDTLQTLPPMFRYSREQVTVFLPNHVRLRVANHIMAITQSEQRLTELPQGPIIFHGWKIVDGYEPLLAATIIKYSGIHEMYTYTFQFPK